MEGKVSINNKINHFVGCIDVELVAEPVNTILSGQHGIEHESLKSGEVRIVEAHVVVFL